MSEEFDIETTIQLRERGFGIEMAHWSQWAREDVGLDRGSEARGRGWRTSEVGFSFAGGEDP